MEFFNNGLHDSLTHAPAPAIFLEKLAREFSSARRDFRTLALLSLQAYDVPEISIGELEMVALARAIEKSLRSDEFYSRISESGFWIAIRGDKEDALALQRRVAGNLRFQEITTREITTREITTREITTQELAEKGQKQKWLASVIECEPSVELTTLEDWIQSVDRIHFPGASTS